MAGLEPARYNPRDFKSLVSAYSTTSALCSRAADSPTHRPTNETLCSRAADSPTRHPTNEMKIEL